jgi:hypothetical protein
VPACGRHDDGNFRTLESFSVLAPAQSTFLDEFEFTARGTVSVAGASKLYRFKAVSRSVAGNVPAKLRLRLDRKKLKAVKRALKKGKRLKAKIIVTAVDKAQNKRSQNATIRLKN